MVKVDIEKLEQKLSELEKSKQENENYYDEKVKEKTKEISEKLRNHITEYFKKNFKDKYDKIEIDWDGTCEERLVVVLSYNHNLMWVTFEDHMKIWKEFYKYKNYIRLCYQWDFNSPYNEGGLPTIISRLKKNVFFDMEIESKLYRNYQVIKDLMEIITRLKFILPHTKLDITPDIDYSDPHEVLFIEVICIDDDFVLHIKTKKEYKKKIYDAIHDLRNNIFLRFDEIDEVTK